MFLFRLVLVTAITLMVCGEIHASEAPELKILRSNFIAFYTGHPDHAAKSELILSPLRADGSWQDVDYSSQRRSDWPTRNHLSRVLEMAREYRTPGHQREGATQLRSDIAKALEHWLEQDYRNPNWWNDEIGVPMMVASTMILMGDDLPAETRNKAMRQLLDRSRIGSSGQNKVWLAGIAFMRGMLEKDAALMHEAHDAITSELRIIAGSGVQPDYSFHQHGPQQQWGTYGREYGKDMVQWATIWKGTSFGLNSEQILLLRNYLVDGAAWTLWRGQMDISACGRQLFPGIQAKNGRMLFEQLRDLHQLAPPKADAIVRVLDSQDANRDNKLLGHKHYWSSDISIHRQPSWYSSVKMSSTRVIGSESCNSDNLQGLHLGDGVTFFYVTGTEYLDIFPLWNWQQLPGTTCRMVEGSLNPSADRCRGSSDFVGGVSAGRWGLAAMEYGHEGLAARKSYFFLDDAVVCLGTDIRCNEPGQVTTSVNQCRLEGPVTVSVSGNETEMQRKHASWNKVDWIHHGSVGYLPLWPQHWELDAQDKRSNWRTIHGPGRAAAAKGSVFSLWTNHGQSPRNAKYGYAVLPAHSVEMMRTRSHAPVATIVRSDNAAHVLSTNNGEHSLAALFEAQKLALQDGIELEVDHPCLILLEREKDSLVVHLAEPTHRKSSLTVRLRSSKLAPQERRVSLPAGDQAGSTVTVRFAREMR
ncbi:MAG: hypothetical protein IT425_00290 [Pirellulales bacterium]|nr:hypothetical protein [Pirellulales bacterium]